MELSLQIAVVRVRRVHETASSPKKRSHVGILEASGGFGASNLTRPVHSCRPLLGSF